MQVTETKTEGLKRAFSIVVPAAQIEEKVTARLVEVGHNASIPGFRPGKVPMSFLSKRYRPAVMGEVMEAMINECTAKTVSERKLRPAVQPKIEIVSFDDGKDLEFSVEMEVLPEIAIADLSKISLERLKASAPEEDVEKALANVAQHHAHAHPVVVERAAANGDAVTIDFVGKLDGTPFPGGEGKDFDLELGSGMFIPGFEEQLVGVKAGDAVEVKVTFPADYHAKDLAGKETTFDVTLKAVKEFHEHPVNDELAQHEGLKDLDELRKALRSRIEEEFAQASRQRLKRVLLDALDETHKFEVPSALLEGEFAAIWKSLEEAKANGTLDPSDVDKSEEALKEEYQAIAERRVRLGLLLAEIGRINNIQVSKEDLQRAVFQQARQFPGQERQVFEYFTKNQQAMEQLQAPLFEEKTVDFVLELVQLTDREVSPQELMADPDEAEEAPKKKAPAKKKPAAKAKAAEEPEAEKAEKAEKAPAKKPAKKKAKAEE
ncbi:trigger factor [Oleispirillum naphthae]|uniref:trigger factor n=1 Tax=Oleispirillum naphthae TaxID=2838853 RepID=UPI0030823AF5